MTHPAAMAWCTISFRHDSVSRELSYSSLTPSAGVIEPSSGAVRAVRRERVHVVTADLG